MLTKRSGAVLMAALILIALLVGYLRSSSSVDRQAGQGTEGSAPSAAHDSTLDDGVGGEVPELRTARQADSREPAAVQTPQDLAAASGTISVSWNEQPVSWRRARLMTEAGEVLTATGPGRLVLSVDQFDDVRGGVIDGLLAQVASDALHEDGVLPLSLVPGGRLLIVDEEGNRVLGARVVVRPGLNLDGPVVATGWPLVLPAVEDVIPIRIEAPGYRSLDSTLQHSEGVREVQLAAGALVRFHLELPSREARIVIQSGGRVVDTLYPGKLASYAEAWLRPGEYSAQLEQLVDNWGTWELLDSSSFTVSELRVYASPEVHLNASRVLGSLECKLVFQDEEAVRSVVLGLLDEAGARLISRRIEGTPRADGAGIRAVKLKGIPPGEYHLLVNPDGKALQVTVEARQVATARFDLSCECVVHLDTSDIETKEPIPGVQAYVDVEGGSWELMGFAPIEGGTGGTLEFRTSAEEVSIRVWAPGYAKWSADVVLQVGMNNVVAELQSVLTSQLKLDLVLEDGRVVALPMVELAKQLRFRSVSGEAIPFERIRTTSSVAGVGSLMSIEFNYVGEIIASVEGGVYESVEHRVVLSDGETSRLSLPVKLAR